MRIPASIYDQFQTLEEIKYGTQTIVLKKYNPKSKFNFIVFVSNKNGNITGQIYLFQEVEKAEQCVNQKIMELEKRDELKKELKKERKK